MKIAYVIGRMQPMHKGHQTLIDTALALADKVVIILGDTGCRPDYRNPWTVKERAEMIRAVYSEEKAPIVIRSVEDTPYDDMAWKRALLDAVVGLGDRYDEHILVGHKKDASTFYLDMFPEWRFVNVPITADIDATTIRRWFFMRNCARTCDMSAEVISRLRNARFNEIAAEAEAVEKHKQMWDCPAVREYGGPIQTAVDVLLETPHHVLLIERGSDVGKGAIAMVGGFVNHDEWIVDAGVRELEEEAGVHLVLKRNYPITPFDYPRRSMRGRIITNLLHVKLPEPIELKAGDDAERAFWALKSNLPLMKRHFFSDHYHIVQMAINKGE